MLIQPVTFGRTNQFSANFQRLKAAPSYTPLLNNSADTFTLNNKDNLNFTGVSSFISNKNDLKKLAKNGHLSCIWCGGSMFMQHELDAFQHFATRLSSNNDLFIRVMLHFSDYLPKERIALVKQIAHYNKAYPDKDLKTIFNIMTPVAENRLVKKQLFIFHNLKKLRPELPVELQKDFDILLEHSKYRILEKPYISEYSAKEFCYQLNNLSKSLPPSRKNEILNTANILTHPIFKEAGQELPEKWLKRVYKQAKINPGAKGNYISPQDYNAKEKLKLLLLKKIMFLASESKNQPVIDLCKLAKDKVLGKPVTVKFSNKAFAYKLDEIICNIHDKNLIKKFNNIIKKLPNSLDNKDAFIVKYKKEPIETIITKLLDDSLVTIEHISPIFRNTNDKKLKLKNKGLSKEDQVKRGTDSIGNWALAHRWCNAIHGSQNIKHENFPFSKEAGIKYFKTIIQDANNGLLSGESVIKMAQNYFEQTGIRIKLTGLKYTPE